jgi:holo-[acyl-carrier protein] synthase
MLTTGVDLIEIARIERVMKNHGERFLARVFTQNEVLYCRERVPELAARFAAKEAVSKALGVGMRHLSRHGIGWHEVEVLSDPHGKPLLRLTGRAAELAEAQGLREWAVSLSHERDRALAFVVAQG